MRIFILIISFLLCNATNGFCTFGGGAFGDGSQTTSSGGGNPPGGTDGQVQTKNGGNFVGANMYFDANGNAGIGIQSPTVALDVHGIVRSDGGFISTGTGDTILNQSGGNVGVGTTTPLARLDVNGDVQANRFITTGSGNTIFNWNAGNVGIGTTGPISKFQIWGGTISGNPNIGIRYDINADGTDDRRWAGHSYEFETGTVTETELQNAINSLSAQGGGTVHIILGNSPINIDGGSLLLADNVAIVCDGGTGDHFKVLVNSPIISAHSVSNVAVEGCTFNGNKSVLTTQQAGIAFAQGISRFRIKNNRFHDTRTAGVYIAQGQNGSIVGNHFWAIGYTNLSGSAAIDCLGDGSNYCHDILIADNFIEDVNGPPGGASSGSHGIHTKYENAYNVTIINNHILSAGQDCILLGSTPENQAHATHDNIVIGNDVQQCGANGIDLFGGYNNIVADNYVHNLQAPAAYGIQVAVSTNDIISNNRVGIGTTNAAGMFMDQVKYIKVDGNEFYDGGIVLQQQSVYNTISHNTILDPNNAGIQLKKNSSYNKISDNTILDTPGSNDTTQAIDIQSGVANVLTDNYTWSYNQPSAWQSNNTLSSYDVFTPRLPATIFSSATTFTGVTGDKIAFTDGATLYDNIDVSTATSVGLVGAAINNAIDSSTPAANCLTTRNGYLQCRSSQVGSTSTVTIADGSSTSTTVIGRLFSTVGSRSATGTHAVRINNFTTDFISNVGLGTFIPASKLTVNGSVGIGTAFSSYVTTAPPSGGMIIQNNVGIGSVTPGQILDVQGTARMTGFILNNSPVAGSILMTNNVGLGTWIPASSVGSSGGGGTPAGSNSEIQYRNAGSFGAITNSAVTSAGNIGLGTTLNANKLDVQGGVGIGSTYAGYSTAPSNGLIVQGNVGIGSFIPEQALVVNGGIKSTAAGISYFNSNLGLGTTVPNNAFVVNGSFSQQWGTNIPTISSCGTSPTVKGTDNDFQITVGSVSATACTATFGGTYSDATCAVTNQSMSVVNAMSYTVSPTAIVISQTGLTGNLLNVHCGFKN